MSEDREALGGVQEAKQTKAVPGITSHQGLSKLDPTEFHSSGDAVLAGKVRLMHDTKKPSFLPQRSLPCMPLSLGKVVTQPANLRIHRSQICKDWGFYTV